METLQDFNKIYPSAIYVQRELQSLSLKFSFCINFLISLIFFDVPRHLKKIIEEKERIISSSSIISITKFNNSFVIV